MRHNVAHRKLGRVTPHRIAMLRNMATALFERERIRTTLPKAIQDPAIVKKLFDTIGARFAARPGGYTRILRLGTRHGDGAEMAYLELVGYEYKPEGKADKTGKKEGAAKDEKKEAAPKAEEKAEAKTAAPKKAAAKKAPAKKKAAK